jgi:hypothetical protein
MDVVCILTSVAFESFLLFFVECSFQYRQSNPFCLVVIADGSSLLMVVGGFFTVGIGITEPEQLHSLEGRGFSQHCFEGLLTCLFCLHHLGMEWKDLNLTGLAKIAICCKGCKKNLKFVHTFL